ncbi:constitutive coactivator of PPAR-gamma-like protein 1 homolog [Diaphorina citri]|uniref:Constitutive coactivator of PPAR-gamma-like protein 1 homolog n=1 Tax=Diaphorina citri TaxID=121845 RepID=A0A3Q0JAU3_DIACI|nr:constitutive coactivator of PPAR-gamma-like protein 1 homolog [Diaphorina citri]
MPPPTLSCTEIHHDKRHAAPEDLVDTAVRSRLRVIAYPSHSMSLILFFTSQVLKHITTKGTPPPKIWWIPPCALSSVLRMAYRTLHVPVGVSSDNHKLEVLQYLTENGISGLVADDGEYIAFQPPRYFSSKQLKLRFKGNIETKEYMVRELLKGLDLPKDRLCVLASLLGTSFLSSAELSDLCFGQGGSVAKLFLSKKNSKAAGAQGGVGNRPDLPNVPTEVLRTVAERHSQGAMSPLIYQIYTHGQIRLPVLLENEDEVPNCHLFYRPIRQKVYAILFNLHHHTFMALKNKSVGQWGANYNFPAVPPSRGGSGLLMQPQIPFILPPVHRYIITFTLFPVHRYIMTFTEKRILRRQELDAFIVTAVSPEVMNSEHMQDLQLPLVTSRGVQLSTLFMAGVDTALLVNDACGAPIPWLMNCPWLFFDGKLFNYFLAKASGSANVEELCDHRLSIVVKVEKMRQAILEGIDYQFARPPSSFGHPHPASQGPMLHGAWHPTT